MPQQLSITDSGAAFAVRARHFSEQELDDFYARWTADPQAIEDDEFDTVQLHLLRCEHCFQLGSKCEHQHRQRKPVMAGLVSRAVC